MKATYQIEIAEMMNQDGWRTTIFTPDGTAHILPVIHDTDMEAITAGCDMLKRHLAEWAVDRYGLPA